MTVPIIDGIDMTSWSYARQYGGADKHFRGIFEWGLLYKESEITDEEEKRRTFTSEPFRYELDLTFVGWIDGIKSVERCIDLHPFVDLRRTPAACSPSTGAGSRSSATTTTACSSGAASSTSCRSRWRLCSF